MENKHKFNQGNALEPDGLKGKNNDLIAKYEEEINKPLTNIAGGQMPREEKLKILQLFDDYRRMYATRDDLLTTYFSRNFSGFTGGGDFLVKDTDEWIKITRQDFAQVKDTIRIELKDLSLQTLSDSIVVTTGFFKIHLPIKDHILSREIARLVLIFRKENADWKITHSSISIPYQLVREGEVYPMQELVERNRFLEEMVTERTALLSNVNENLQTLNAQLAKEIAGHKLSEEALLQSNKKLEGILSASPDGIGIISLDGKMKFISDKLARMYGVPLSEKNEFIGIPVINFVDPSDHKKLVENLRRLYTGEKDHNITEYKALKNDGSNFFLEVNSTLLLNSDGVPESILLIERDITERKKKEEELQQSTQKWEALISASPDGIGMITLEGKIQLISDKLVAMHGYSVENKEQYYGRSIFDFIDPSSHKLLIENTQKLLAGKSDGKPTEYLALKQDKSQFNIDVKTSIINDINGRPASILYVERDITERKHAERALQQSSEKWEAIISASPDGIGMISLDGKMQLMSDKLLKMYGYTVAEKDEIIGKPALDFIEPSDHEKLMLNMKKLIAGEGKHQLSEYVAIKKDKTRFNVDVNSSVLHDSEGNPVNILFIERDITERKQAEKEIKQKNIELAELNATKDKFFSIIAHDLKSPFQGLLGYSQILSADYASLTEEEKMASIVSMGELASGAYKLLENLLEWSRIQTGGIKFKPERFNLLAELYQTLSLGRQTAQNKKIEFSSLIEGTISVKADKNMLTTVVRNLISNSVKFTNPGGRITLYAEKSDGFVKISIADTGVGIEKENLKKLFLIDKGVIRKGTANEDGTGLGLLLCKEMIEKNGGVITVESAIGVGSTFSFTIPAV